VEARSFPESAITCYGEHYSKPYVVVPIVRIVPVADRATGVILIVVPRTAPVLFRPLYNLTCQYENCNIFIQIKDLSDINELF
jgi:hypothetical protein